MNPRTQHKSLNGHLRARYKTPFPCVFCGSDVSADRYERHCKEKDHPVDPKTGCVWCCGVVAWKRGKKHENVGHIKDCARTFLTGRSDSTTQTDAADGFRVDCELRAADGLRAIDGLRITDAEVDVLCSAVEGEMDRLGATVEADRRQMDALRAAVRARDGEACRLREKIARLENELSALRTRVELMTLSSAIRMSLDV